MQSLARLGFQDVSQCKISLDLPEQPWDTRVAQAYWKSAEDCLLLSVSARLSLLTPLNPARQHALRLAPRHCVLQILYSFHRC